MCATRCQLPAPNTFSGGRNRVMGLHERMHYAPDTLPAAGEANTPQAFMYLNHDSSFDVFAPADSSRPFINADC